LEQETPEEPGRVSPFRIIQELGIIPDYDDSGIICESNQLDVKINPET
jgi:hypothetical protein